MVAGVASMGMPGFSGFVAELQVLIGAFQMSPWLAAGAALSIPVTVAYILNANNKVFMERDHAAHAQPGAQEDAHAHPLPPISLPEKIAAVMLMALLLIVGLYPSIMLDMIKANVALFLQAIPVTP
jgi:NADH-quinone oxidoreductase subunit M